MTSDTASGLEIIRIALAIFVGVTALFGAINVTLGELILPRVARGRLRFRRRMQMTGFAMISVMLGAQSTYVATIPDPTPLPPSAITGNLSVIGALSVLFILSLAHIAGWWREGTIAPTPLVPDDKERADLVVARAREIAHTATGALQYVTSPLELILLDKNVSPDLHRKVEQALSGVEMVKRHVGQLHDEIKNIGQPAS